ncbi:BrnT family toxin [Desulfovibrio aminophilus]|uniref:BrnT family toxin n=1 Tax=Desulfovibrio aminophilus TaxID=81425 RepID=UPI00339B58B5
MTYMITSSTVVDFDPGKWEKNFNEKKYGLNCMRDILDSMLFGRIFAIFSDEYEKNGEMRFSITAEYQGDVIFAACTWRDDGDTLRVISFRPASDDEEEDYYEEARAFLNPSTDD